MTMIRSTVRTFIHRFNRPKPAREPWSYFGSFGDDFLSDEDATDNAPLEPTGCGCGTSPTAPSLPAVLAAAMALAAAATRRRRR